MAKRVRKTKLSSSESSVVPHAGEVAKHFSPTSVNQQGLGPAFFAVVAAIIILILLSIWGGYNLSGYATGPSARTATVTFTPYNNYLITVGGYTGRVQAIRFSISNPMGSTLTGKYGSVTSNSFLVVTRKIDATALPVGSVVHATGAGWVLDGAGAATPVRRYDGYYYFGSPYFQLYSTSTAYGNGGMGMTVIFSLGRSTNPYPVDVTLGLNEIVINSITSNASGTTYFVSRPGAWSANWDNVVPLDFNYVSYAPQFSAVVSPLVGYVSPGQSTLMRADGTVSIGYSYDNRLCTRPAIVGYNWCIIQYS